VRRRSADFGQTNNLGFFGGSNMPWKLDGFLKFAQRAELGAKGKGSEAEV
jgi:hypothetical protein